MRVIGPSEDVSVFEVPQVAPGFYRTSVALAEEGSFLFRVVEPQVGGTSRILPYSYPEEYHFYPTNEDLLRHIAEETGGQFDPDASTVARATGETVTHPTPLWPYLAALGLVLFLTDILLRRLRLFEEH